MATIYDVPNNSPNTFNIDQMVHKIYNQLDNQESMSSENISDFNNYLASVNTLQVDDVNLPVANINLKLIYNGIIRKLNEGNGVTWNEMSNLSLSPLEKKRIIKSFICNEIGITGCLPNGRNGGKKKRVRFKSRRKKSSGRKSHRKKKSPKKRKTKRSKLKH